jgi:hypothetical protein
MESEVGFPAFIIFLGFLHADLVVAESSFVDTK